MKRFFAILGTALLCSHYVFGADKNAEPSYFTLSCSEPSTRQYMVPQESFTASRKIFRKNDRNIYYGNVLCVDKCASLFVIKEIWYRIKKENHDTDEKGIMLLSEKDWKKEKNSTYLTAFREQQEALSFVTQYKPYGISDFSNGATCTLQEDSWLRKTFEAPRCAVLLCLLLKDDKNDVTDIFCVSSDNKLLYVSFSNDKGDLKSDDVHKKIVFRGSKKLASPQQRDREKALTTLKEHILLQPIFQEVSGNQFKKE